MNLEDLADEYKVMFTGIGDWAEPEDQKKGIHDVRRFETYPAYPWKNNGTDHFNDNAKTFCDIAKNSGLIKHIRKEDLTTHFDPPISYSEWVERHKNEPGWVNHLETKGDLYGKY